MTKVAIMGQIHEDGLAILNHSNFDVIEITDFSYKNQLEDFVDCIINKKPTTVNFEDGRKALIIANAAYDSFENKKAVKINYS